MKLFDRDNREIADWRDWTRPKKTSQWKASRSAMELARAWFTSPGPVVPPEIAALLDSDPRTQGAVLEDGWPEHQTLLPEPGEGRNHDLVLVGRTQRERLLVAVEGKVDETMGPPVGVYWRESHARKGKSRAWRRVETLLTAVFGEQARADRFPWQDLPYQMLTAMAGTAIEAESRKVAVAVLVLHEFVTESADKSRLAENAAAFTTFLQSLGAVNPVAGRLYGPFEVRLPVTGTMVPVLLGKAQYHWRDPLPDKDQSV